ncbi:MAG: 1-deoxy-D-xylulose-5-phosphate reductoisomerase [Bacteroidota bacterium]|nr:1-deoxy-D-xylulose-5-phosphate reductoisomerase [Bacteroidota bacterium]MDP4190553.1 1-deoxy-D-xylulose-5-phosphate reductoisomerase [Bacteroidota bacterium]MDP4194213.1 1-deoxy-D-xylulose-5-phosphate reductoisomerase [Bacteroidota bacterium]
MKKIFILGSTGSIGTNTLDVIRNYPDRFKVETLTVNSNIELLEKQIKEFNPSLVVVRNEKSAEQLKRSLGNSIEVLSGDKGLIEATRRNNYDILVSALVGFAGLAPTIEGIKLSKRIALANKETLVVAGELITALCKECNSELVPVDSEHSAIFQCLVGEKSPEVKKLILTASGGPFLHHSSESLKNVSVAEALNHPNWKMGSKVTIDSASMMNKGLEVIEAQWLFGIEKEKIEVVVHPQSIVHSMVEFIDGSIKAQMGLPDMRLPIQYALSYPERLCGYLPQTKLPEIRDLSFFEPDYKKFECLKLAYQAIECGGTAPCILNAANEIAVGKFLEGSIRFLQIPEIIKKALNAIENHRGPDINTIFDCDRQTREFASKLS